jgi:hypothetical protein
VILYLTYNDQPSGVYWSQVTDVVEHLNTLGGEEVRLVALVSLRDFRSTRRKIKEHSASAVVLPMVPTMRRWRRNTVLLAAACRRMRPSGIICRGPFATWMALRMRDRGLTKKICYDGRGAYAAEWEEYRVIDDDALIAQLRPVEQEAVLKSDFRLAVSHALVKHWHERYGYEGNPHVVIPCTLASAFLGPLAARGGHEGMQFIYSGSAAGWQSFDQLSALVDAVMERPATSFLFMSPDDPRITALVSKYPTRVKRGWSYGPEGVREELERSDMGILIREDTITNRVASPTKFAEYLACGLPVLIGPKLGDFSELVITHGLGVVHASGEALPAFRAPTAADRERCRSFALEHFTKSVYDAEYQALLDRLS